MALPAIAGLLGAAAAGFIDGARRAQLQSRVGGVVSGLKNIASGSVGGFVATQVLNTGQGNIIPFIPTVGQTKAFLQEHAPSMLATNGTGVLPGAGGATGSRSAQFAFGRRRRYRRMDVTNVKALRRAGRRVEGFVKLARSLVSMPGARAKHPIKRRRRR